MTVSPTLDYTTADDPFLDFCLWPYQSSAAPGAMLRSSNLLMQSFRHCGVEAEGRAVIDALCGAIGPFQTVWGIKYVNGELRWELYFYDYRRLERERSITRVMNALQPIVPCPVRVSELVPYFMFSIDLTTEMLLGRSALDEIHVYIGNVGSSVSSGICYSFSERGTVLENFYFFFDAARERDEIVAKVCCSAHVDLPALDVDRILWPELRQCKTLVVANKRFNDGVYFSRIGIAQLQFFLERLAYPAALAGFVAEHAARLGHLHYDVGLDYRMEGGAIRILKSGFYGIF